MSMRMRQCVASCATRRARTSVVRRPSLPSFSPFPFGFHPVRRHFCLLRWRCTMSRPRLVLFGDSLTQFGFGEQAGSGFGWISRLSSTYSRRADVLSRGFSGYNTRHALEVLPRVLADLGDCGAGSAGSSRVLFFTLWFGANDAALPGTRQHVPVEEYASNLKKIVETIRASHKSSDDSDGDGDGDGSAGGASPPIILITPPPVYAPWWEDFCKTYGRDKSDRTNDASRQYGLAMKSVGDELKCETLDTWELLGGDVPGFEKHLTDGLHLSEEGNKAIYEGLMALVEDKFFHLAPMTEGEGRYGTVGVPLCEKLWTELC